MSRSKRARARARGRERAQRAGEAPRALRPQEPVAFAPSRTRVIGRSAVAGPRAKRRLAMRVGAFALAVVVLGLTVRVWHAATSRPAWFDATDPRERLADAAAAAVGVENRVTREMSARRGEDAVFAVTISEEEANAWLSERLRLWLDRESPGALPESVRRVAVDLREGGLVVGVDHGERPGAMRRERNVLSVSLSPVVDEGDGRLDLRASSVGLNSLALPAALAGAMLPSDLAGDDETVRRLVSGGALFERGAELRIDESRRALIRGVEVHEGSITVRFATITR